MAAYDPDGELAEHVRFQIDAWQGQCRRLILVTTNQLTASARDWLAGRAELIERDNVGYDFYSYRTGLLAAGDLTTYDQVVICNDTYVGPLRGFAEIFARMHGAAYDFWGVTRSRRIKPHVQSFFVVFGQNVVASDTFTTFWTSMEPISSRRKVIHRYEVGLSRTLKAAGFSFGSYYSETRFEWRLARLRVVWWALRRRNRPQGLRAGLAKLKEWAREPWNPMAGLADAALDDARLPVVKIDTLRYDPYGLDAARLLRHCSVAYPDVFAGLDAYFERTNSRYPPRPNEVLQPAPLLLRPLILLLRYR
jgi:rhamnosyltransferase